jgi:hypothetical protein
MHRPRKFLMTALAFAALGAAPAGAERGDPIVAILKWVFQPVTDQIKPYTDKVQATVQGKAKEFRELHQCDLVITNQGMGEWKFGITDQFPGQLKDPPSGTVKVAKVKADGFLTYPAVELTTASAPVALTDFYGTLVVTPVCASKNLVSSQKFARVCYLEDGNRRRIYLTLTKDTSGKAVPVVGVAGMSNQLLYEQNAIHFSDREMKNFNAIGILIDKIK